jgi:hypothetical protein
MSHIAQATSSIDCARERIASSLSPFPEKSNAKTLYHSFCNARPIVSNNQLVNLFPHDPWAIITIASEDALHKLTSNVMFLEFLN